MVRFDFAISIEDSMSNDSRTRFDGEMGYGAPHFHFCAKCGSIVVLFYTRNANSDATPILLYGEGPIPLDQPWVAMMFCVAFSASGRILDGVAHLPPRL